MVSIPYQRGRFWNLHRGQAKTRRLLLSQSPISGEGFGTVSTRKDAEEAMKEGVSIPYQRGRFWNP